MVKSKANLLEAEIKTQTDVLKKLKDSNGSKSAIKDAATLLFSLKKDLALAEIDDLLEYDSNLKTDWKNDPVAGIDWNSVPVVQDAHEIKLRDELNKAKLDLKIEQKSTERLRNQVKRLQSDAKEQKEKRKEKRAKKKALKEKMDAKVQGKHFKPYRIW